MSATASNPERGSRLTLRLRLTMLYGVCFLVAGAGLLLITYELVAHTEAQTAFVRAGPLQLATPAGGSGFSVAATQLPSSSEGGRVRTGTTAQLPASRTFPGPGPGILAIVRAVTRSNQKQATKLFRQLAGRANVIIREQHTHTLGTLLTESGVALAIMALLSIGLGWLVAGRALRPLRTMNLRARAITEDSLHKRLGVGGRADELGELASSFDGLLARLERAFASQRRFVANASHELRTPVTLQRALVEVALADPDASADSLRWTCERVLVAGEQQERVIEALLALARGQAGVEDRKPVDLATIASDLLEAHEWETRGLTIKADLAPAVVAGDPALLERLVGNLLDNAIVHNAEVEGWIRIETGSRGGRARLRVANPGAEISADRVAELFEPFRRLDEQERNAGDAGLGLGLSIVQAIAVAHGAAVNARPLAGGGLELELTFPSIPHAPAPAPGQLAPDVRRASPFSVQRP